LLNKLININKLTTIIIAKFLKFSLALLKILERYERKLGLGNTITKLASIV